MKQHNIATCVTFFDNSAEGDRQTLFAHFKLNAKGEKEWNNLDESYIPNWFKKYYSAKIKVTTQVVI